MMTEAAAQAWRCGVCGYVHRGEGAPESCPVCGAASSEFEPHVEPAPARLERTMRTRRSTGRRAPREAQRA